MLAGIAEALGINRVEIFSKFFVGNPHFSFKGEEGTSTGVAGGDYTVKHIDSSFDSGENILREANAHQVSGFFGGEPRYGVIEDANEFFESFSDADTSDGVAGKIELEEGVGTVFS